MKCCKKVIKNFYFGVFLISLFYIVIVSYLAIRSHYSFYTNAWDLGIYSQALYTTLNYGRLFYYTAELEGNPSGSLFGIHFSPILFFLLPIYKLYESPITLLVLRPVIICLGLIPLCLILNQEKINSTIIRYCIIIVYLIYPPTLIPFWNFDVEVFLVPLFLFVLYYMKSGKLLISYLFIIISLMVNEFVPFIVICLSIYYLVLNRNEVFFTMKNKRLSKDLFFSFLLFLTGITWFWLACNIISLYNPSALSTKWEWGELGTNPFTIIKSLVYNPFKLITLFFNDGNRKFLYLVELLGPLSFFPLLDPLTMLNILPWLLASFISINPLYYDIGTQYPGFISAFIFAAGINGVKRILTVENGKLVKRIVFVMATFLIMTTLLLPMDDYIDISETDREIHSALIEIPVDASISIMPDVFPHVCNRIHAYPYFRNDVDYILVNIYSWWFTATLPRPAHTAPRWSDADIGDDYGILFNAGGVILYKRGYKGPVKFFKGINLRYGPSGVVIATGQIVQDFINNEMVDVLIHRVSDKIPLFFKTPEMILPPGSYEVRTLFKVSAINSNLSIILEAVKMPDNSEILIERFINNDFERANEWHSFKINFDLKKSTFIEFRVYVNNSTDVYFHSINILQVSGDK